MLVPSTERSGRTERVLRPHEEQPGFVLMVNQRATSTMKGTNELIDAPTQVLMPLKHFKMIVLLIDEQLYHSPP